MMFKYLKQLTQISIINFFFILGLLFFIQYKTPSKSNSMKKINSPQSQPTSTTTLSVETPQTTNSPTTIVPKNLFSEISTHNTKSDCWFSVSGHVYDVTTYFGSHPGGDGVILKYCGTDATGPFTTKDGIGANHSASAYDLLRQYLIQ